MNGEENAQSPVSNGAYFAAGDGQLDKDRVPTTEVAEVSLQIVRWGK